MSIEWIFQELLTAMVETSRRFSLQIVGESVRISVVSSSNPRATSRALTEFVSLSDFSVITHLVETVS